MKNKKFRVSRNKLMASAMVFLVAFMGTLFPANAIFDLENNPVPCLIMGGVVASLGAVLCLIFVKEYYMQVQEDGFELIKGDKVTKYSFEAFAGSNVTRHYMNGIYTGTTREIKIKQEAGKPITVNANNLSKGSFAELVTYLGQSKFTRVNDIEVTAEYFKDGIQFDIPNEKIIKANKNKMTGWMIFTVSLLVLFDGMLVYYWITRYDSAIFWVIMMLAGLGALVELIMETIPTAVLYNKMKNLPGCIRLDVFSLTIGDRTLSAESVLNIMLVPAEYNILTRDFIVITKTGEKLKYNFGKNDHKGKMTYVYYDKLCNAVELWCIVNKINFMQILG